MLRRHFTAAGIETTKQEEGRKRQACVVGFHSLRHSFVSMQARAGIPEHIVRGLVGHASPMVHQIYQHANGDDKRRAVAALPAIGTRAGAVRAKLCQKIEERFSQATSKQLRAALAALGG